MCGVMVEGGPAQPVLDHRESKLLITVECYGEVAEWLKAHAWKVCIR